MQKKNIVPNTDILFLSLYLPLVYRKRELRCRKCQELATNLLSFNISLLQQFTEPRTSVLLNSRNCPKFPVNLHDGDRLSYTQAEELSLATVYRSQQLYTAEQWLNCKKEVGDTIPFPFPPLPSSPFTLSSPAAKRLSENQLGV